MEDEGNSVALGNKRTAAESLAQAAGLLAWCNGDRQK